MIKQFLRDVDWGEVDYLIVDTPPGTSDEHLSIVQYLSGAGIDGAVIITTPQVNSSTPTRETPCMFQEVTFTCCDLVCIIKIKYKKKDSNKKICMKKKNSLILIMSSDVLTCEEQGIHT